MFLCSDLFVHFSFYPFNVCLHLDLLLLMELFLCFCNVWIFMLLILFQKLTWNNHLFFFFFFFLSLSPPRPPGILLLNMCMFIYIVKSSSIEAVLNFIVIYIFRENPMTASAIQGLENTLCVLGFFFFKIWFDLFAVR